MIIKLGRFRHRSNYVNDIFYFCPYLGWHIVVKDK